MRSSTRKKKEEDDEKNGGGEAGDRDGLLYTLVQRLQVCRPVLVLRKPLVMSYLRQQQNYLGITRAEYDRCFRRPGLLTADEHGGVHGGGGLQLRALDRRGVEYRVVLAPLTKTYRLRDEWGRFLRNAGVRQDDERHVGDVVEVWAFRSPAWVTELGLMLLHYTKEEDTQMTMEMSSSTGYHHRQVRRFALPPLLAEEDEDDEDEAIAMSAAAMTLVSMKRS